MSGEYCEDAEGLFGAMDVDALQYLESASGLREDQAMTVAEWTLLELRLFSGL